LTGVGQSLEALAGRYGLDHEQQGQLRALLDVLASEDRAPTSVLASEHALDVHVADSLVALELDALQGARRLADIGSGAGVPGAVLAVALRDCEVSLVESHQGRCVFLRELLRRAHVGNAGVVCARVEEWGEGMGRNDVVSARALAAQPVVLEYAAPLLRVGGVLVDWRGRRDEAEERAAERAAEQLGLARVALLHVNPYAGALYRHLHVFEKIEPTPERFPRRVGVARKRPLGG